MGEVFRARDTRLDRQVALKLLPSRLASDELRMRFEREARAISALSHPHICALYDIGSHDGTAYIVMEFLEGETLAERLARGPLPLTQLLRYGAQIADALQHAHRAGITHRDLKPGNIMITAAGAKLMDFGLAKTFAPPNRVFSEHSAPSTTITPLTEEGMVIGTAMYMAPEQLEGKPADPRTDIFALGVVLYEMVTGQRPFRGDSSASLIAAILSADPPSMRALQPDVPPALERIILTALEKNPDERWQTAHDVGRQLRWISDTSAATLPAAPVRRARLPLAAMLIAAAVLSALATWAWMRTRTASPQTTAVRLQLALPPGIAIPHSSEFTDFAVSPDGKRVAMIASGALYVRPLDSYALRRLEGTEGAVSPFWSSDSAWLGYSARGKLWKTRIAGGTPPEAICDVNGYGVRATWMGDTILFSEARGERTAILRVGANGGAIRAVTSSGNDEWRHSWPVLLPDGRHFLYLSFGRKTIDRTLRLATLDESGHADLLRNISFARLYTGDRLVFVRDGKLLAQRFDVSDGKMQGDAVTVANAVSYFYMTARADFDASPSGVIVYRTNTASGTLRLYDRAGRVLRTLDPRVLTWDHAISPDGRKAAVTIVSPDTGLMDIWIYDLGRGLRDRLTNHPAIEVSPAWSPDGRWIAYSQGEGGTFPHIVRMPLGGGSPEDLTRGGGFEFAPGFAPDGRSLYFAVDGGRSADIVRLALDSRQVVPAIATPFAETSPRVSPDGKWIAYESNATGVLEIYVQSLGGDAASRVRISRDGGTQPSWRADSQELFYLADGAVFSGAPGPGGNWENATTTELFRYANIGKSFAATPDGQSFLLATYARGAQDDLLHVMVGM